MKNSLFILVIFFNIFFNQIKCKEIIIADLSDNKINIDVGFNGAKLLFFGVIENEGDVVVSVTGPRKPIKVVRKEKKMGIWLNAESKTFFDVPSYYYVAASKPLEEFDADEIFSINQIGINKVRFEGDEDKELEERNFWKKGIIDTMIKLERYFPGQGNIFISNNRLFKTELIFSSEIVDGEYLVDTLLLKDGNVIAAKRSFINVSKSGIGEKIHKMAYENSLNYGIFSVLLALLFGLVVHETIRRFNA